jgi:hypothetical protein
MKPSNWLLAAIRALAASMMDLTTRAQVFAADIGECKVVPGGDSKMPCVRYVGDTSRLGTASLHVFASWKINTFTTFLPSISKLGQNHQGSDLGRTPYYQL